MKTNELNAESAQADESTERYERNSKNAAEPAISEAMRSAVGKTSSKRKKDGRLYGVKSTEPRMTPKMRCFASCVAQGMSPRESYIKAYNTSRMGDASIITESNRLMKDPRISMLMESVWESVKENIIDDAIATRRKIMGDLLMHAEDAKTRTSDKLKALELMGRAIGMFTDKSEVKHEEVNAEQLKRELDEHLMKFGKSVH